MNMQFAVRVLAIALAVASTARGAPEPAPQYTEPNLDALEIRPQMLQISTQARSRLSTDLAAYVCRNAPLTPAYMEESSKALGLALLLNSSNRTAVLANVKLRSGKAPAEVNPRKTAAQLSEALRLEAKERLKPISRDETRLAGYMLMLAAELDPDNENAAYDCEMFKKKSLDLSWDGLLGRGKAGGNVEEPGGTADVQPSARGRERIVKGTHPDFADRVKPFARQQSSVRGLFVSAMPTGMMTGQALEIIASVLSQPNQRTTQCRFAQEVGEQMETSWDEALRVVQMRYPQWEGGRLISISFSDKYSPKDGGSAGTALSLLLLSLLDGIELDPSFAVTGDITVDWKVREVGGIPYKLRGAVLDKCKYVAVPKASEAYIQDAIVLNSMKQLWAIQIFTFDDLGQALMTMRTDRDKSIAQAMEKFAGVQAVLATNGVAALRRADILRTLEDVSKLAPNHASASHLLKAAQGKLANRLTLGGSVEETLLNMAPLVPFLLSKEQQQALGPAEAPRVPADFLKNSATRLQRLQPSMDPRAQGLSLAVLDFIKALEECARMRELKMAEKMPQRLEAKQKAAATAAEKIQKEMSLLQQDRRIIEALQRQ